MARVTFMNAILSGKMGGSVYSRNKAGAYVRQWVNPTDPRTVAQMAARATFSSASGLWHAQTDVSKAQWNGFAVSNFNPKHAKIGILYSGQQAFNSLRNTALTGVRLSRTTAFTAPAVTATFTPFIPTSVAPVGAFSASIKDSAGLPLVQSLGSATLSVAGNFTAVMNFDRITPATSPVWRDAVSSIKCGLIFYASNPLQQSQMFVSNPELQIVGIMRPPSIATGWTAVSTFAISMSTADLPISQRKIWYTAGDIVEVTAYSIGENGQLARLNSVKSTVI